MLREILKDLGAIILTVLALFSLLAFCALIFLRPRCCSICHGTREDDRGRPCPFCTARR